jgi:ABC-type multidrug transport system permease subunit
MNLLLLIAALVISVLVFTWLIKVVKATITTAILIAILVLALQLVFGIGPDQVWNQVVQIPRFLWELVTGNNR